MLERSILGAVMMFVCCGCLTNYYDEYYVDTVKDNNIPTKQSNDPVKLRTVITENAVLDLIEEGYVVIGYSAFRGTYTPMSLAVDTAEKLKASLVLLNIKYKETETYSSVTFMPSTSYSHVSGTYGGIGQRSGTYSGSVTTTTVNAIPIERSRNIYDHDAVFFRRVDLSKFYGVQLTVPKRLPFEMANAPIKIRVYAVFKGSQAERDSIKRGQIVKAINGKRIITRKDVAPFIDNPCLIKNMEVADEM